MSGWVATALLRNAMTCRSISDLWTISNVILTLAVVGGLILCLLSGDPVSSGTRLVCLVRLHCPGDHVFRDSAKCYAERGGGFSWDDGSKFLALLEQPRGDHLAVLIDDPGR
jgi:hypothetical protein